MTPRTHCICLITALALALVARCFMFRIDPFQLIALTSGVLTICGVIVLTALKADEPAKARRCQIVQMACMVITYFAGFGLIWVIFMDAQSDTEAWAKLGFLIWGLPAALIATMIYSSAAWVRRRNDPSAK